LAADGARGATRPWFLVSGGSGGIGAAVCRALAERGYTPVVGYCTQRAAAEDIAERCAGKALKLDLRDEATILAAAEELEQAPELAGVVLAGSPPLSLVPFGKISREELVAQLEVNVIGPQRLLAELVRRCFRKHKRGSVVGVLTRAIGDGTSGVASGMGAYVIAKQGMAGMLGLLSADYPWLKVRSISPGYTETRMLDAFDPRFLELQREKAPFQSPATVAALILEQAIAS
jgi:NAD(P)-dependent dehydrogenase (short-subunit alcohol dehydrogenase family)